MPAKPKPKAKPTSAELPVTAAQPGPALLTKPQPTPLPPRPVAELTPRQRRYLKAAFQYVSSFAEGVANEAWLNSAFDLADIGKECGFPPNEAVDIGRILDRDFALLRLTTANTDDSIAPYRASLTDMGREVARQMRDNERAARRAKVWAVVKFVWATAMTIAVGVSVAVLNRRIQSLEQQPKPQPASPATAPTARP